MKPASTARDTGCFCCCCPSSSKSTPVLFSSEEFGASLVVAVGEGVRVEVDGDGDGDGVSGMCRRGSVSSSLALLMMFVSSL